MKSATAPSALKVQALLGEDFQVLEFDASTRTAADAAAAIGCTVGRIAKSLIFSAKASGRPVLAIASGSVRVDEKRLAARRMPCFVCGQTTWSGLPVAPSHPSPNKHFR